MRTLTAHGGNKTHAARALGIPRTYLWALCRELEVSLTPRCHWGRPDCMCEQGSTPSEIDERFRKCPWLFKKGNKVGRHRQKRSQVRLRMENLIQRLTDNGDVIVQFFCAVASGQPFVMRYVEKLPRTPEQEAVALGIATDVQKAAAKKQRRYLVTKRPYYPSMAEITEAFKWLADRGFGQAPKTVQIEGSVTTGFKMVFRRWAPGTDPASLPLAEMPKSIVGSSKILDFPTPSKPGKKDSP